MPTSNPLLRFSFKPLVLSLHLALSTGALLAAPSIYANNAVATAYSIPAGDLAQGLNQFAVQSGVAISTESRQLKGLKTQGLNGQYTIDQGFAQLLAGSGYQAQKTQDGYVLIKTSHTTNQVRDMGQLAQIEVNTPKTASPDNITHLPVITVQAEQDGYKANKVALGKIQQSVKETPQSISILTSKRLEDSNYATLDQALSQVTGMSVQTSGNVTTNYYSRGFEVAVQKDGINSGYAAGGERAMESLALYDQVEIQRGASGLLTGAGQPGGVVNLVRKKPLQEDQINIAVKAGSWNMWNAMFDISNTFLDQDQLRTRFVVDYEDKDYFFDIATNQNLSLYGVVDYDVLPSTTLTFGTTYNKREAVPEITGVPRNADGSDSQFDKTKYLGAAWNTWDVEAYSVFSGITHQFNDDWSLKINGQYENRILNYQRAFYNADKLNLNTHVFNELTSYYSGDMKIKDYGMDATLNGKFQAFGQSHDLVFGYTSQKLEEPRPWTSTSILIPAVSLENFDPYSVPRPNMPSVPTTSQRETSQRAFFAMTRLNPIEPLHVIIGARLSDWKFTNKNLVTGANTGTYEDKNVLTPYGGIVFDLNEQLSVYASYSDTFRVQSNNYKFGGDVLDPAVGANYEMGIKRELWDDRTIASFALFRIDEDKRSMIDAVHPDGCSSWTTSGVCYINGGKVRSEGFEAELSGELIPDLQLTAGYTYNKTEYLNDTATNTGRSYSTFTPKQILRVWGSYNLPFYDKRLTLGGGVNLQSESKNISKNVEIIQSGYGLWNAFANYKVNEQINVAVNFNNIFDKTYYKKLGTLSSGNYYGDPRNFMITLRAKY